MTRSPDVSVPDNDTIAAIIREVLVHEPDAAELSAIWSRIDACGPPTRVRPFRRTSPGRRWRLRPAMALAVIATAVLVSVGSSLSPDRVGLPTPEVATARSVLLNAGRARVAAPVDASYLPLRAGQFLHVQATTVGFEGGEPIGEFAYRPVTITESWFAADGSGRTSMLATRRGQRVPHPVVGVARYGHSGRVEHLDGYPFPELETFSLPQAGTFSIRDEITSELLDELPTTRPAFGDYVNALARAEWNEAERLIVGGSPIPVNDENIRLLTIGMTIDLLAVAPLSPGQAHAAFGFLADQPDARLDGTVRDELGRQGRAITFFIGHVTGFYFRTLVVDETTGASLQLSTTNQGELPTVTTWSNRSVTTSLRSTREALLQREIQRYESGLRPSFVPGQESGGDVVVSAESVPY